MTVVSISWPFVFPFPLFLASQECLRMSHISHLVGAVGATQCLQGVSLCYSPSSSRALTTITVPGSVPSCLLLDSIRTIMFIPKMQLNHNMGIKITNKSFSQGAPVVVNWDQTSTPVGDWFTDAPASLTQGQGTVCWPWVWASFVFSLYLA